MKTIYILNNIGTPIDPSPKSVGKYLTEFLTDPDVISLPFLIRQFLVRVLIVPRRAKVSAKKYQSIWSKDGSPLMIHSLALQKKMQEHLDGPVLLGMQFGEPSVRSAFKQAISLKAERIVFVPLYPQYAQATTGSAIRKAQKVARSVGYRGKLDFFPSFPTANFFLDPLENMILPLLKKDSFVLFSFHGLPESQIKANSPICLTTNCCDRNLSNTEKCYKAQCTATARALAERLGLDKEKWKISFQSRLGKAKWIGPYTDEVLQELAQKNSSVLVISPSFISDCLETLEELGVEGKNTFLTSGGKSFVLSTCVNSNAAFAKNFALELKRFAPSVAPFNCG